MKHKYLLTLLLASAGLVATGQRASATTITVTGTGYGVNAAMIVNGTAETEFAGQILATLNPATSLITFCVDLFTGIGYATYNTTLSAPASIVNGGRVAWLVNTYAPTVNTNNLGAALQLAIWDVVHDGGNGLGSGVVRAASSMSSTLRSLANNMITASVGRSSINATIFNNVNIGSGLPAQNLIAMGIYSSPPSPPVPEPATWVMMAAGLGVLGRQTATRKGN